MIRHEEMWDFYLATVEGNGKPGLTVVETQHAQLLDWSQVNTA